MKNVRTEWINDDDWCRIKECLTEPNRLAIEVSERYGLRIGDVLKITTEQLQKGDFYVREGKTGKSKRIRICDTLRRRLYDVAGCKYVFEGRNRPDHTRTRQAVYNDIRRACQANGIEGCIGCHTARKIYAVRRYIRYGLDGTKKLMNHDSAATTMIYALSDKMESDHEDRKKKKAK